MDADDEVRGVNEQNKQAEESVELDQPKVCHHRATVAFEILVDGPIHPELELRLCGEGAARALHRCCGVDFAGFRGLLVDSSKIKVWRISERLIFSQCHLL